MIPIEIPMKSLPKIIAHIFSMSRKRMPMVAVMVPRYMLRRRPIANSFPHIVLDKMAPGRYA